MEPRLAKPTIEDRLAIEDLFVRYAASLDRFDIPGIESCFVEDGILETPNRGVFQGVYQRVDAAQHEGQGYGRAIPPRHLQFLD